MRMRTVSFIFREGLSNFYRNKLMFFASCAIVTAALIILGVFLLIVYNIDENVRALDEKPQIQIYCRYDLTGAEVDALEAEIRSGQDIKDFVRVSKEEAFARARELLGENADILDGMEPDFLPVSFIVKLGDASLINDFVGELEQNPLIDKITYPKQIIDLIVRFSNWTKIVGAVLAGIPILFAVFIISNTIRIAVFERRSEIGIMRYIGATEQLIRWPFIVEGMITGIVGATAAFVATGFGYRLLESNFNLEVAAQAGGMIRLAGAESVSTLLLAVYLAIGVGVGAIGSARSIRKYLRV